MQVGDLVKYSGSWDNPGYALIVGYRGRQQEMVRVLYNGEYKTWSKHRVEVVSESR